MEKTKVYDLPTRLFHWLFVALFAGAFFIAKTMDDDSNLYPYHMMMGMTLALIVVLRVIWGMIGSRYARFTEFSLKPTALIGYFKNLLTGKTDRALGHNPASSWSALIMMGLALGLATTGILMAQDINKEFLEEIHELFANAFIVVVIGHVAGILFHMIRHRDGIALSMLHGKKNSIEGSEGIQKNHTVAGIIFLGIVAAFIFYLNQNYNPVTQNLNLFGTSLQLGENEAETTEKESESEHDGDGDDD
jgi:cytochrome b